MTANRLPITIAYVAARIIPDTCSLALLLLGLPHFSLIDGSASALADTAAAAGTFAVLVMLCMAGLLGGGDAKLITASTFFLKSERLADFFHTTVLSGGVLSFLYLNGHALLILDDWPVLTEPFP